MVFGGKEGGGGVRSRPGAARTILLFHIISARSSNQTRMVGSTLGVYSFGLIFVSARTNKRHHHHLVRTYTVSVVSRHTASDTSAVEKSTTMGWIYSGGLLSVLMSSGPVVYGCVHHRAG